LYRYDKEEIRDLLVVGESHVTIRDAPGGASGVVMVGVKELEVTTVEEMAAALSNGSMVGGLYKLNADYP
jgi:hypothetical protein